MQPERLGPYKIERRIGRGGMGTVFAAVADVTGERAAIKVLSAGFHADSGLNDRFSGEIESLRRLRHPNIVRIFGFGEDQEVQFYAMELIEGLSLQEALDGGRRFTWQETAKIGVQICRALKHAHDHGIVHRDIKPANLLLTVDGNVKLSDFGIAKLFGNSGLTADGGVIGTAEYMAPEQADGRGVTSRSDLYSVGGVLYALLLGRPPFRARSLLEMLQLQRFADPEPPIRIDRRIPRALNDLILQLLVKDPSKRIPTALVVSRQLESLLAAMARKDGPSPTDDEATAAAGDDVGGAPLDEPRSAPEIAPDVTAVRAPPPVEAATMDAPAAARVDDEASFSIDGDARFGKAGPPEVVAAPQSPADAAPHAAARAEGVESSTAEFGLAPVEARPASPSTRRGEAEASPVAAGAKPAPEPTRARSKSIAAQVREAQQAALGPVPQGLTTRSFTSVDRDERLPRADDRHEPPAWISPATWVLVASMLVIGLLAWYWLQPPSAERLYDRIAAAAKEGEVRDLLDVEREIHDFMNYYPGDRRMLEMQAYQEEIDLHRLEKKFEFRAKFLSKNDGLAPIERAYFEAIGYLHLQPSLGRRKLAALVELYRDSAGATKQSRDCLQLAIRQLDRLDRQAQEYAVADLQLLRRQLARAKTSATANPAEARKLYESIIELYGDEPWADEPVAEARRELRGSSSDEVAGPARKP